MRVLSFDLTFSQAIWFVKRLYRDVPKQFGERRQW
jgi:hypothetical protein